MPHELDHILISHKQPDFQNRLDKFLDSKLGLSHFGVGAPNRHTVEEILDKVVKNENRVDEVLAKYTWTFDKVKLAPGQFLVSKEDLEKAHKELKKNNPKLLVSIQQAIKNVRKYQEAIYIGNSKHPGIKYTLIKWIGICFKLLGIKYTPIKRVGICFKHTGIKYTPIKRVGICVPGASAPLPSTVIMCAVPAQVAGVEEIVVVSPPRCEDSIHPVTLAVCHELGIDEVYRVGGAQAVAALTFGTDKDIIKQVDKIVGPGNPWVQTAKQLVFGTVGIDSIAGPSEVLIIANEKANPAWVAADMLSQAEHNPGCAFVFSTSQEVAGNVLEEIKKQVGQLNRSKETIACLKAHSGIAVFENMDDLIKKANEFTAEHLEIQCGEQSRKIADRIENAGAIFIGDYSPVAVGDYWAGPSHTLPTGISAKFFSALSANDFIKSTSIIEYDQKKLAESAENIILLAEAEGLDAHAKSIKIRQRDL